MNCEKRLTLEQIQDELEKILPERPATRTLYAWMARSKNPMPFKFKPGQGRWFLLSDVLAWLDAPSAREVSNG